MKLIYKVRRLVLQVTICKNLRKTSFESLSYNRYPPSISTSFSDEETPRTPESMISLVHRQMLPVLCSTFTCFMRLKQEIRDAFLVADDQTFTVFHVAFFVIIIT